MKMFFNFYTMNFFFFCYNRVIWSKIYNYRADCDHEELDEIFEMADNPERDNRLLILW